MRRDWQIKIKDISFSYLSSVNLSLFLFDNGLPLNLQEYVIGLTPVAMHGKITSVAGICLRAVMWRIYDGFLNDGFSEYGLASTSCRFREIVLPWTTKSKAKYSKYIINIVWRFSLIVEIISILIFRFLYCHYNEEINYHTG